MLKLTSISLALSCMLAACGGGGADAIINTSTAQTTPVNTAGIVINKAAGPTDAYSGGLHIIRDASGVSGGTRGNVNSANVTHTVTGVGQLAYEWATLSYIDNYAAAGENVATYSQAIMHSTGPTWAAVSECRDAAGLGGACVAHEFDISGFGPENNNRYGIDVAINSSNGGTYTVGSTGVRVTTPMHIPGIYWKRAFEAFGRFDVGLDTSTGVMPTALRLKEGQAISLEATDQILIKFVNGRIQFVNANAPVFEIDMVTGDTYKKGVKQ